MIVNHAIMKRLHLIYLACSVELFELAAGSGERSAHAIASSGETAPRPRRKRSTQTESMHSRVFLVIVAGAPERERESLGKAFMVERLRPTRRRLGIDKLQSSQKRAN